MITIEKQLDFLCCPKDRHELELADAALVCKHCNNNYEIFNNIVNFTFNGTSGGQKLHYITNYPDDEFMQDCDQLTYHDLVNKYWVQFRPEWKMYRRKWPDLNDAELKSKVASMWARARLEAIDTGKEIGSRIEAMIGPLAVVDRGIDVACGNGMLMTALVHQCRNVLGIDLNWKDLFLAAKLLHEIGHKNFALYFGYAEALPFKHAAADVVTMNWAMEHIGNKNAAQSEIARVHNRKHYIYINNVNRFRLIEPHTGVPLVGYLPKILWNPYVQWMANRPYSPKQYSPIGYYGFKKLLKRHFSDYEIYFWHEISQGPLLKKIMNTNHLFKLRPIQKLINLLRLLTYKTYFAVLYPHIK